MVEGRAPSLASLGKDDRARVERGGGERRAPSTPAWRGARPLNRHVWPRPPPSNSRATDTMMARGGRGRLWGGERAPRRAAIQRHGRVAPARAAHGPLARQGRRAGRHPRVTARRRSQSEDCVHGQYKKWSANSYPDAMWAETSRRQSRNLPGRRFRGTVFIQKTGMVPDEKSIGGPMAGGNRGTPGLARNGR